MSKVDVLSRADKRIVVEKFIFTTFSGLITTYIVHLDLDNQEKVIVRKKLLVVIQLTWK